MFSNWFNVGVQCTSYRSVLMCGIGMYSRLIRGWVQCTRYMSGLMCDIVFQLLIRDGGTVYSEYFWVDVWYRYSAIDLRGGGGGKCTRNRCKLTRGEYGMEWWQAIDSQFGTMYPVHVWFDMWWVWYRMVTSDWFTVWYSVPGYMSGSTCGDYGMEWYKAIDSRRGTVYPVQFYVDKWRVWYVMVTCDWFAVGYRYPVHVWFGMWWAWCSW